MVFETAQDRMRWMLKSSQTSEDQFLNILINIIFGGISPETHSYESARNIVYQQLENDANIISTMGEYPNLKQRTFAAAESRLEKDWAQRRARDERDRKRYYLD